MNFSNAFDLTLKQFSITGKALATEAGLREATVSTFRNGGEIRKANLEKLLQALPPEAKQFLFLNLLTDDLNSQGIASLLGMLSTRLKESQSNEEHTSDSVISRSPVSA